MVRLKKRRRRCPVELEEGVKTIVDELKEVNLGNTEDPQPIYTSASLTQEKRRDLNNAYPKDDFPLPIVELMIDATTGHEALSFMDGSSRYSQIQIEQAKIDVILRIPEPQNIHELKSLQGKLTYLRSNHLVSKANLLKYAMEKPVLLDGLARWYLQLQQFEITYVPQKAVKGQVLADFLADHPMPAEWELSNNLPDQDVIVIEITPPWKMYFDGASHKERTSEMVIEAKQLHLQVYRDSQLVVNQLLGLYEVKKPELLSYHSYAKMADGMVRRCRTQASTEERQQTS
ncbi:hypothetical protein Sango_2089100 [Sesamum angolense]|uniref:Uncharacterized protein n=1 Tax=Sesamum angolense TaxID=2727404 RepID=A0AAE2BLY1_9LAMI|nr:hypothetical protein Sango_2089100 [Sesamum angolense]